jgi:DNA invertase Pin-like site-specific DNA recombinase
MKAGSARAVRCAVYTRVSTDQRLEQDFNSLDAQYDASQVPSRAGRHPIRSGKARYSPHISRPRQLPARS